MKASRLYRFLLLITAGGMVFQAGASCIDQLGNTFATTLLPALSSALTTAITDYAECDTTAQGSISPPDSSPFTTVNDAIQGLRSQLGLTAPQSSGSSSQ